MVQCAEELFEARGPLIIYANHSSWWDPMVSVLLAQALLPERRHYAPMDAAALKRYPILGKIGIFPVEMASARGAAQFLRASQAILASGGVVWVTPQGRFADSRERPLGFKPGLAALAARTPEALLLPLAIEYTFWDERLPETLLRFGNPLRVGGDMTTEAVTELLESALADTMQELKTAAMTRDASAFRMLLRGGRGAGGLYGLGRRMRAIFTKQPLHLDHTERRESPDVQDER
jgi:1-acyl-sn-glycerol-3-phosphate acyltransferase